MLKKLPTVGSEPLLILGDDYEAYYIKNSALLSPAWALVNETLCHYLLRIWGLPTPDAAFVKVEEVTLQAGFGIRHKPPFYERPAFGSKEISKAVDLSDYLIGGLRGKVDFRKFQNLIDFAMIGLFDMWVENEDRPPDLKNILLTPYYQQFQFVPIDHAMAFRTGAYSSLEDQQFWATEGQYCLQSALFRSMKQLLKQNDKRWVKGVEDVFYLCVEKSKAQFWNIVTALPQAWGLDEPLANTIYAFLFCANRNRQVFEEFIRICQQ